MASLVTALPETLCSMRFSRDNDVYVAKITAGKKHFLGTLCIVNPPAKHLAISSHGRDQIFIIEGSQYEFQYSISRKGLPKLTAIYTEDPINSRFIQYEVSRNEPKLRWAKFERSENGAGFVIDPVKDLRAQFFGVLPFGSKLKLIDPSNEVVKTIIIKPGGYNEEIECAQSGNTITPKDLTKNLQLTSF